MLALTFRQLIHDDTPNVLQNYEGERREEGIKMRRNEKRGFE